MTTTKTRAASAARSSSNGTKRARKAAEEVEQRDGRTVEFRGLTLTLEDELPKTFMWDAAESADNDVAFYKLVQSLIDAEQRFAVRAALAESDGSAAEFMQELSESILGAYGLGLGESSASQGS